METSPSQIAWAEAELAACRGRATGWDASCEQAAANLALALAEAGIEADEMQTRFRGLGLSWRGTAKIVSQALHVMQDREEQNLEGATPLCPHCLKPIGTLDNFCPQCLGPVTAIASIDPMGQVFSAGRAYQNAVSDKPRRLVVWGMWMIFGPGLAILIFVLCMTLRDIFAPMAPIPNAVVFHYGDGPAAGDDLGTRLLQLALICAGIMLNAAILWKVTARWLRSRRAVSPA
jgi:hypothetical protein